MNLGPGELSAVLRILEKIDSKGIRPRHPGSVGRFLRQYWGGRETLDTILAEHDTARRADSAVSGAALGAIELHPLLRPKVTVREFPLQEVAQTVCFSEELGGAVDVVLWLKVPRANAAYNMLIDSEDGLRLTGDYRWTPLGRLTPGESHIESAREIKRWQDARCLRAVADDLGRPPHALEYASDYRLGPPGLKFWRTVAAQRRESRWHPLPALMSAETGEVLRELPGAGSRAMEENTLALLLVYREPWSSTWTIVKVSHLDERGALVHLLEWADYQRELLGLELDREILRGLRRSLQTLGIDAPEFPDADVSRRLNSLALGIHRQLRGVR